MRQDGGVLIASPSGNYKMAHPWIRKNGVWEKYTPFIYTNGQWKMSCAAGCAMVYFITSDGKYLLTSDGKYFLVRDM